MANRTFFAVIEITVAANAQGQGQYTVDAGNKFRIDRIGHKSTGAFDLIDIADGFGNRYTNASSDEPLPQNLFPDYDTDLNVPFDLPTPITITGNGKLQLTVKDTSGSSNTITFVLEGFLEN